MRNDITCNGCRDVSKSMRKLSTCKTCQEEIPSGGSWFVVRPQGEEGDDLAHVGPFCKSCVEVEEAAIVLKEDERGN